MNILIEIENIGNIKGKKSYKLAEKSINIIEAPNRWGKSTFIKGISLCLSTPLKSYEMIEIAKRMGLVSKSSNHPHPLVNIDSKYARITIKFDSINSEIKLNSYNIISKKGIGDERFLLTSVLNRSSELLNKLISGYTNLNWLIKILSISWKYDAILEIIHRYASKYQLILDEIKNRNEKILVEKEKLKTINKRINDSTDKIRELDSLINKKKLDKKQSELVDRREIYKEKIRDREVRLEKLKKKYRDLVNKIDEFTSKRKSIEIELEELRRNYIEKEKELKQLINRKKELEEMNKEAGRIIKKLNNNIDELREKIGRIRAHIELHEKAIYDISFEKIKCPLCGEGELERSDVERRISYLKNQENELKAELFEVSKERTRLLSIPDELDNVNKSIEELKKEINRLKYEENRRLNLVMKLEKEERLRGYEEQMEQLKQNINRLNDEINGYKEKLYEVEKELSSISRELEESIEKLKKLRGEREELLAKVEIINEKIRDLRMIDIEDMRIDIDIAFKKVNLIVSILEKIEKYLRREKLREENYAITIFNTHIKNVLNRLGYKDLNVWIDAGSRDLHVVKNGVEFLPYRTLSESELYLIVTLLTIAMKIAYTKDIPILLIDELILSFDENVYNAVIKLLSELANNYGWCIVVTRIGESEKVIHL